MNERKQLLKTNNGNLSALYPRNLANYGHGHPAGSLVQDVQPDHGLSHSHPVITTDLVDEDSKI